MFRQFKNWLGKGDSERGDQPDPSTADDEECEIPPGAQELAQRIAQVLLTAFDAQERSSDIETLTIAPYRVLVQMIPLRVYVYALGSVMGDMEFEAIRRSQRPPRSVFDAFEVETEGVRCGFYVYSLQPIADEGFFQQLSRDVRGAAGASRRPVPLTQSPLAQGATSMDPEEPESNLESHAVSLDGDPEVVAEQLIAPTLWRKPLAEIDLSTQQGQGDLLARFVIREGKASMEKDEIIRFVERNRQMIPSFMERMFGVMTDAAKATEGGDQLATAMQDFREQVNYAYSRDHQKIQTRSDRLFWLIYVLGAQLSHQQLSYDAAVGYLEKRPHCDRITSAAVQFMIHDYAESIDRWNRPATEMLMLIGEAACIIDDDKAARAALGVVLRLGRAGQAENLVRYVRRMEKYLYGRGSLDKEDQALIHKVIRRYETNIGPEDF